MRVFFKSICCLCCFGMAYGDCVIRPGPISVSVPIIEEGNSSGPVNTLYQENVIGELRDIPLEVACCSDVEVNSNPLCLIVRMVDAIRSGDFAAVEGMYSADTRMVVRNLLRDDEVADRIRSFWEGRGDLHVSIFWLVAPNYLIAYVVPESGDIYMPFIFEYTGQWFLVAGKIPFKSKLSESIDLYYARKTVDKAEGEIKAYPIDESILETEVKKEIIELFDGGVHCIRGTDE